MLVTFVSSNPLSVGVAYSERLPTVYTPFTTNLGLNLPAELSM